MKDRVLSAYAKMAADYEKNVDSTSGFNIYYERPAMMKLLPDDMDGLVALDAGCAAGWYTEQLLQRGARVTAVDFSPEMVAACGRRAGSRAEIHQHDLSEPLPFDDDCFDIIVSSLTLHYIDDWVPTFREFSRVLKPGAQFVFSVHHPIGDFTLFDRPDYFAHELLVDEWNKQESGPVEVVFFRRPLAEIINTTVQYFRLNRIVEPQPTPDFKEKLPNGAKWYEHLMTHPHFLIVEVRKA